MNSKYKFHFDIIVGLAGIVSLITVFVAEDKNKAIISLVAFCFILLWSVFKVWTTANAIAAQKYPEGYARIASLMRYTCLDGMLVRYEDIKIIQCKRPALLGINDGFKWSGTKIPSVTCPGHTVSEIVAGKNGEYDHVHISFSEVMLYNQVVVLPIAVSIDDSDHKSFTRIGYKVREPIQLINFRVELGSRADRSGIEARVERMKFGTDMPADWQLIDSVSFDPIAHCYEKRILYPEVGYFYHLVWDR